MKLFFTLFFRQRQDLNIKNHKFFKRKLRKGLFCIRRQLPKQYSNYVKTAQSSNGEPIIL